MKYAYGCWSYINPYYLKRLEWYFSMSGKQLLISPKEREIRNQAGLCLYDLPCTCHLWNYAELEGQHLKTSEGRMEEGLESLKYATQIVQAMKDIDSLEAMHPEISKSKIFSPLFLRGLYHLTPNFYPYLSLKA